MAGWGAMRLLMSLLPFGQRGLRAPASADVPNLPTNSLDEPDRIQRHPREHVGHGQPKQRRADRGCEQEGGPRVSRPLRAETCLLLGRQSQNQTGDRSQTSQFSGRGSVDIRVYAPI